MQCIQMDIREIEILVSVGTDIWEQLASSITNIPIDHTGGPIKMGTTVNGV